MTVSSWLNFGGPAPPERGFVAGRKFLAPRYYGQRAVFASLGALFLFILLCLILYALLEQIDDDDDDDITS